MDKKQYNPTQFPLQNHAFPWTINWAVSFPIHRSIAHRPWQLICVPDGRLPFWSHIPSPHNHSSAILHIVRSPIAISLPMDTCPAFGCLMVNRPILPVGPSSFWTSSCFCCRPKGLDDRMGLNEWESWANVAHRMHKKLRIILTPHGLAEHIMGLAHIGCSDCIIFPLPPPNTNGYWTKLDDDRNCLLYSSAD